MGKGLLQSSATQPILCFIALDDDGHGHLCSYFVATYIHTYQTKFAEGNLTVPDMSLCFKFLDIPLVRERNLVEAPAWRVVCVASGMLAERRTPCGVCASERLRRREKRELRSPTYRFQLPGCAYRRPAIMPISSCGCRRQRSHRLWEDD